MDTIEITKDQLEAQNGQLALLHTCRRRKPAVASQRKFLAACGGKVTFNLDRTGAVVSTEAEHKNCTHCAAKLKDAVKIIFKSA